MMVSEGKIYFSIALHTKYSLHLLADVPGRSTVQHETTVVFCDMTHAVYRTLTGYSLSRIYQMACTRP